MIAYWLNFSYMNKMKFKYNMKEKDLLAKVETNIETLCKRQKCILYGKNTDEYKRYSETIPK